MASNTVLIYRDNQDQLFLSSAKRKGSKFECSILPADVEHVKGKIHLTIGSNDGIIMVEEFPKLNHELLLMQIERHLEQQAMIDRNTNPACLYKNIEDRGPKQLLSLIILPEKDVLPDIEQFSSNNKILETASPSSVSIAALIAQFTQDPVMVIVAQKTSIEILCTRDGTPLYSQVSPLEDSDEIEMPTIVHAVNICKQTLQREFEIASPQLVCLGVNRTQIDISQLGVKEFDPDFSTLIDAENEMVYQLPELYGGLFVEPELSFVPKAYHLSRKILKASGIATAIAGFAGIVLCLFSWIISHSNQPLEQSIITRTINFNNQVANVRQEISTKGDLTHLSHYLDILSKSSNEPHVGNILVNITDALPQNVFIEVFQVEKIALSQDMLNMKEETFQVLPVPGAGIDETIPGEQGEESPLSDAETNLNKTLQVSIQFISEGEYSRVRARFEKALVNISKHFVLDDIGWRFEEAKNRGYLEMDLRVPKEKTI